MNRVRVIENGQVCWNGRLLDETTTDTASVVNPQWFLQVVVPAVRPHGNRSRTGALNAAKGGCHLHSKRLFLVFQKMSW